MSKKLYTDIYRTSCFSIFIINMLGNGRYLKQNTKNIKDTYINAYRGKTMDLLNTFITNL